MTETVNKFEVSSAELEIIANALETQSKILCMQAGAGGNSALAQLNEVKRVLATISNHRDGAPLRRDENSGLWSLMRSMRQAT